MEANKIMIRWSYRYTRLDTIVNEVIRETVRVAPIEDQMSEARLRLFDHVKRRSENAQLRRCQEINFFGVSKRQVTIKKSWNKVIKNDLKFVGLMKDMTQNKSLWRSTIKVGNDRWCAFNLSFGFCLDSDCCYVVLAIIISCI